MSHSLGVFFTICLLVFHCHSSSVFDSQFEREEHFENIDATLLWSVNERNHEIEFVVDVPTFDNGWIGAGISEYGSMKGLDAWIFSEGELNDHWITDIPHGQQLHQDLVQNVQLLGFEIRDGRSRVHFVRNILTCDYEDLDIKPYEEWFVIAYGYGPVGYHGQNRQAKEVNLLFMEKEIYYNDIPETQLQELIFSNNFELNGGQQTQYHYSYLHIDDLGPDFSHLHVTKFQPMPETSHFMHHMTLYACPGYESIPFSPHISHDDSDGDEFEMNECELFVIIAKDPFLVPPNTGLPLGGTKIWLLEVHFEYWGAKPKTVTAGISTFLDLPRENPITVSQVAAVLDSIYIPPKSTETITYTIPASLISEKIEESPMTILLAMGHMHLTGVSFLAEQIRNNKVIRLITNQKAYDFDRQTPQRLQATIIRGDEIRISCTYTNPHDHAIRGGGGTDSEMCNLIFAHIGSASSWKISFCDPSSGLCNVVKAQGRDFGAYSLDMDAEYDTFGPAIFKNPSALVESSESLCELFFRDDSNIKRMSPMSFGSYESCTFGLSLFVLGFIIDCIFRRLPFTANLYNSFSISKQKKRVVYLVNIIIGISMLAFLLMDLQPLLSFEYKSYDVPNFIGVRVSVYLLEALYMWELCYRVSPRAEIIAHHVLTIFITEYQIAGIRSDLNVLYYLQLGWTLMIQIPLEIPTFIALSLKDYDHICSRKNVGYFFWMSSLWNFLSKISVLAMSMVIWAQILDGESEEIIRLSFSEWKDSPIFNSVNKFGFPFLLILLFLVQILHCLILFGIGHQQVYGLAAQKGRELKSDLKLDQSSAMSVLEEIYQSSAMSVLEEIWKGGKENAISPGQFRADDINYALSPDYSSMFVATIA